MHSILSFNWSVTLALREFFNGASFAGWFFWLPRLLLILLRNCSLEL
jgi:hypothetical protein